ncbi:hypothetical protein Sjap_003014 [Stephania japonica]|uniref:Uncharacterized protein n=1 Tax=Stephania japonica TaxID=461633 RepID=A0AAP0KQB8_9MAGN
MASSATTTNGGADHVVELVSNGITAAAVVDSLTEEEAAAAAAPLLQKPKINIFTISYSTRKPKRSGGSGGVGCCADGFVDMEWIQVLWFPLCGVVVAHLLFHGCPLGGALSSTHSYLPEYFYEMYNYLHILICMDEKNWVINVWAVTSPRASSPNLSL